MARGWLAHLRRFGKRARSRKVAMGDAAALAALPIEDADTIRRLPDELGKPHVHAEVSSKTSSACSGMRAFSDVNYARALGLYATLARRCSPVRTPTQFRALTLKATPSGRRSSRLRWMHRRPRRCRHRPTACRPRWMRTGVSLSWNPPAENRALPAISLHRRAQRKLHQREAVRCRHQVGPEALAGRGPQRATQHSCCLTRFMPWTHSVAAASLHRFASSFRIFARSPRPLWCRQRRSAGKIVVTWTAGQKPNLAGYLVERLVHAQWTMGGTYDAGASPGTGAIRGR